MQMIAYREQPSALKAALFDFEPEHHRSADTLVGVLCWLILSAILAGAL